MKNSLLTRAVALPAALLLGLAGSAFVAAPALAETPAPAATDAAVTPTDAATTADTSGPKPAAAAVAPVATTAPTPAATTPAPAAATPAPAATAPVATSAPVAPAAAPKTVTVLSPKPVDFFSDDEPAPVQLPSRSFDITGTAPVGITLEVDDWDGDKLATLKTTATTFTIPITIADDAAYDQYLDVFDTRGIYDDSSLYLEFPAATSVAPTLDSPTSGTVAEIAPLPFGLGTVARPQTFSGTGTPGDDITLFFTRPGETPVTDPDSEDYTGSGALIDGQIAARLDTITVDADGAWTGQAFLPYGTTSVSATQAQLSDDGFSPVTHPSPVTPPILLTVDAPEGTVLPPVVTTPGLPDDGSFDVVAGSTAVAASAGSGVFRPLALAQQLEKSTLLGRTGARSVSESQHASSWKQLKQTHRTSAAKARLSPRDAVVATDDDGDLTPDEEVVEYGIQVKGTASTTTHGSLTTTVSGTGTPGDHVVLSLTSPSKSQAYFETVYPTFFSEVSKLQGLDDLNSITDPTPVVTSKLPADDGSITVAADGTWSTSVTLRPGPYELAAFDVSSTTKQFSVASNLVDFNLTGTPIVDPAAATTPTELAFTGSTATVPLIVGFGILGSGIAMLAVATRRRRSAL